MQKIETTLETLLEDLKAFYDETQWHFLTINGVDNKDGTIELQWIFARYMARDEIIMFSAVSEYETVVPSIVPLIPSARLGEREVVDMFGIVIEGAEKGLYLDEDSLEMPLRCPL
jgi:NADH:ubiquinone oxidoreductase subunit C